MRHRPTPPARAALVLASALALLGGCAEMHRGVEAVGRIGSPAVPAAEEADAAPVGRPDVKTVRPRGAPRQRGVPRAPDSDTGLRGPDAVPGALASAVPSPRQIFDFHPAGTRPDGWRQPFVIDTSDGPLAADVRRSTAELKSYMADQKAGEARHARTQAAEADGTVTGTTRRTCSEMDVASAKPGCGVPPAAATSR